MAISGIEGISRHRHHPVSQSQQVGEGSSSQDANPDMKNMMSQLDQLLMMIMMMLMRQLDQQNGSSDDSGSGSQPQGGGSTAPAAPTYQPQGGNAGTYGGSGGGSSGGSNGGTPAVGSASGGSSPTSGTSGSGSATGATGSTAASQSAGPPSGKYINAADYGVVGDGKTDNTAALQKAFDAGQASGEPVYLGAGTYAHSGTLDLRGTQLNGDGESTVLKATDPSASAIKLSGNNAGLSNVKAEVDGASTRSSSPNAAAVLVQNASNATVSNVVTQGASSNGIRLDNAQNSTISGNLVQGSNADGIALMNGSSNNKVSNNVVYQAGDDSYSDDSYNGDSKQDSGNVFSSNMALDGQYGRGFALMGSTGDTVTGNTINGVSGVGIATGTDGNSGTMTGGGDNVSGNTVLNQNDANSGNATVGTPQAVQDAMGSTSSVSDILGWAATLVDKSQYGSGYQAGTGSGSNNSGGVRS